MRSHENSGSHLFQKCSSKSGFGGKSTQDVPWDYGVLTSDNGEAESVAYVAQVRVAIAAVVDLNTRC